MTREDAGAPGASDGAAAPVLAVEGLKKAYGATMAVDGVSFQVGPGEIVGLLGPNGAGKTTTINMVLGVLAPTAGTIRIDGLDLARRRCEALQRTNFAAVYAPLPGNLTVAQNLRVFGLLYGVRDVGARVEALLAEFDLGAVPRTRRPACSRPASRPASRSRRRC